MKQRRLVKRTREGGFLFLLSLLALSAALSLMVLGLARSVSNLSVVTQSLAIQQAFHAAEGALGLAQWQLQQGGPPSLIVGTCSGWSALPPEWDGRIQANYRLCLIQGDATASPLTEDHMDQFRYQIDSTGTTAGITRQLATIVDYAANTVTFNYASYADNFLALTATQTGGMDTRIDGRLLRNTTFQGNLAVGSAAPVSGWVHAIELYGTSTIPVVVQGNAGVAAPGDPATLIWLSALYSSMTGVKITLPPADVLTMHQVRVPPTATDLGDVVLYGGARRCLTEGAYVVHDLILGAEKLGNGELVAGRGAGELCTTGVVDLYVTGRMGVYEGELYGQPSSSDAYNHDYDPMSLRIFSTQQANGNGVLLSDPFDPHNVRVAAAVYAPETGVTLGPTLEFLGGIISHQNPMTSTWYNRPRLLLYDEPLRSVKIRVGPAQVDQRMWGSQ